MKTKFKHTRDLIHPTDNNFIRSFYEFAQLKNLYRQGWLKEGRNVPENYCESVADHSFGVALLGYVIARELRTDLDALRVMRLGLFHEMGEIYTGDITPLDEISGEEKHAKESQSVREVFSKFNRSYGLSELREEFEEQRTPEARFIKQIDRLEMVLQARLYEKLGCTGLDAFFPDVQSKLDSPELKSIFGDLIRTR